MGGIRAKTGSAATIGHDPEQRRQVASSKETVTDPAIKVDHLTRRYGSRVAVDDVSFAVERGEILGLLGRNGAGKTTTVEILEGYRVPSFGSVRVLGRDPRRYDRRLRARIGVVLQLSVTEPLLRVQEVVDLYASFYRPRRLVSELLAQVGLTAQERTRVSVLSGGQRRRLDVALALAGDPEVLFLDEPTTGLDPEGRRLIWKVIASRRAHGAAILLTSHYLEEIHELADRAVVLHRGQVIAEGSPDELRGASHPDTVISFRAPSPGVLPEGPWEAEPGRPGWTVLRTSVPTEAIERLSSWAVRNGTELEDLEMRRPSLEEAYLELTAEP